MERGAFTSHMQNGAGDSSGPCRGDPLTRERSARRMDRAKPARPNGAAVNAGGSA